ncbi:MAG: hypothetical protein CMF36_10055 [Leeuwenhoekiella sp.]|nr:hypothetical protein [Leeuwenhoekiella sp.]MBA81463.1 hypothetical protein [Leeuwenhoekiella sp.]|tara:strand:- start:1250 stop:1783 length:534 start_codon:yes stop_codon:yes gene_type:complete
MSMTQTAFLRKADIPTKTEIEELIQGLGYDFRILDDSETITKLEGLSCSINGHETFFETYFDPPTEITNDCDWIKPDLTNQDLAISFVWGADFAAGACIGLISIALIDKAQALIYYLDDEMKYSREMLVADTPQFLGELEKQKKKRIPSSTGPTSTKKYENKKKSFWDKLKVLFKQK